MTTEAALASSFRARLDASLVDAEAALQAENWQVASRAMEQAETIWTLWRKWRDDWLMQFAYLAELAQQVASLSPVAMYLQTIERRLEDAGRNAPDQPDPARLRDQLDILKQQINYYIELRTRLDQLNELCARLPTDSVATLQKVQTYRQQLDNLAPDDKDAFQTLYGEVEATTIEMNAQAAQVKGAESYATKGLGTLLVRLLAPPPAVRTLPPEHAATGRRWLLDARGRLRLFTLASYLIAVALLAGAGFVELYVARPTFGANPWSDYFALLAWGFGAEASRAAITDLVRGWGLLPTATQEPSHG
jgi:hypothetical protein